MWAEVINEGYYMAGEGGKSHAKAIMVAGSWGTKGIMSQDLEHFGRKDYTNHRRLLITVNSDQCGICFPVQPCSLFLNMPRNCRPDFTTQLTFEGSIPMASSHRQRIEAQHLLEESSDQRVMASS